MSEWLTALNSVQPWWISLCFLGPICAWALYEVIAMYIDPRFQKISRSKRYIRFLSLIGIVAHTPILVPDKRPASFYLVIFFIREFSTLIGVILTMENILKTYWIIRLKNIPRWLPFAGNCSRVLVLGWELSWLFVRLATESYYLGLWPHSQVIVLTACCLCTIQVTVCISRVMTMHESSMKGAPMCTTEVFKSTRREFCAEIVLFGVAAILLALRSLTDVPEASIVHPDIYEKEFDVKASWLSTQLAGFLTIGALLFHASTHSTHKHTEIFELKPCESIQVEDT
eukprot:326107_1